MAKRKQASVASLPPGTLKVGWGMKGIPCGAGVPRSEAERYVRKEAKRLGSDPVPLLALLDQLPFEPEDTRG